MAFCSSDQYEDLIKTTPYSRVRFVAWMGAFMYNGWVYLVKYWGLWY